MGFRSEEFIKESDSEREEDSEAEEDEIIEIQAAETVQLNPADAEIVELDSDDDEDDEVIQFNTTVKDDGNKTANDTAETEKLDDTIELADNSTAENTSAASLDTSDQQNGTNEEEGDNENDDNSEDSDVEGDEFDAQDNDEEESSDDEQSDGEGDEPDNEGDEEDPLQEGNENWADAISKVLNLGDDSKKKIGILSKAKKDNLVKKVKNDKANGDQDSSSSSDEDEGLPFSVTEGLLRAKKLAIDNKNRVKPNILKKPKERGLIKIATKGVVQLFNAVREQQKWANVQHAQAQTVSEKEKVYKDIDKSTFMAVIEGKRPAYYNPIVYGNNALAKKPKLEDPKEETKDEIDSEDEKDNTVESSTWSALRENFMLDSKLKDWDKEELDV